MTTKKATRAPKPATFPQLVKALERALKKGENFKVVRPEGATAKLTSLKLRAVQVDARFGASGVRILCEAVFEGRHAPHEVLMNRVDQAEIGVADIKLGMGASPYDDGTVCKGMTFSVLPQALSPDMLEQVSCLLGATQLAAEGRVLAGLAASAPYRNALERLHQAEQEAARAAADMRAARKELAALKAAALKSIRPPARKTLKAAPAVPARKRA